MVDKSIFMLISDEPQQFMWIFVSLHVPSSNLFLFEHQKCIIDWKNTFDVSSEFKSFILGLKSPALCKFMAIIYFANWNPTEESSAQSIHCDPAVSFVNAVSVFQLHREKTIDRTSLSNISVIQEKNSTEEWFIDENMWQPAAIHRASDSK